MPSPEEPSAKEPEAPVAAAAPRRVPPFQGGVAISLSGGGFRAAGFHLGVLTILHRTGLLERAKVLSTVSGGSIVGARLMLGLARGDSFSDIHYRLCRYLEEARPIPRALQRAAKTRVTLTQALAEEWNETLFEDSRHAVGTMREILDARLSFEEGSFNATSVRSGKPFRFTFSRGELARIGHQGAHLPRKVAENLRVADVVAASCAFPGGFEPLVMPDDFVWPDADVAASAREALKGESYGLVDGGVHDNQGIDPMLLAAKRLDGDLGLMVVSDADRGLESEEPRQPAARRPFFRLKVWHLNWLSWILILTALTAMGLLVKKAQLERDIHDFRWTSDGVAFGIPGALCGATILVILYARFRVKKAIQPLLPHLGRNAWRSIRKLGVVDLIGALQTRVQTLKAVTSTAFPRRVRGLVYRGAWSDSTYADRRMAVQMNTLTEERFDMIDGLYPPSDSLRMAAERASRLPTSLELGSPEELDDLQRAGQGAAIAKVIETLEMQFGLHRGVWPKELQEIDARLKADWDTLNTAERALRPTDGQD